MAVLGHSKQAVKCTKPHIPRPLAQPHPNQLLKGMGLSVFLTRSPGDSTECLPGITSHLSFLEAALGEQARRSLWPIWGTANSRSRETSAPVGVHWRPDFHSVLPTVHLALLRSRAGSHTWSKLGVHPHTDGQVSRPLGPTGGQGLGRVFPG